MHDRKKKEQRAAPRRVDASGDEAAEGYDATIHHAEDTYATAVATSRAS